MRALLWLRTSRRGTALSLLVLGIAFATGCAKGEYLAPEADKIVSLPAAYQGGAGERLERWCTDFQQPGLDALIDQAVADNFNIKAAWARLEQSELIAKQSGAAQWPTMDFNTSATRSSNRFQFGTFENTTYQSSLAASYELDLWGRIEDTRQAAVLDAKATRADVETLAITTASLVAEAWFDLVYNRALKRLIEEQLTLNEQYVKLLILRLSQGRATALDITQQEQLVDTLRAQLRLVEAREKTANFQLAALIGKTPQRVVANGPDRLPEVLPPPALGIPADLLDQRPDVRAARLRLEAADKRTSAAVAAQLPTLRLNGSLSLTSFDNIAELFDALLYSIGGSVSAPILDGGRRAYDVKRSIATARGQLYTYGQTLLDAMREVETALANEQAQIDRLKELEAQRDKAIRALELSRQRYQRGALDYLRILTAIQSLQQLEQTLLDAKRQQIANRIQLCRALGGSWTRDLKAPEEKPQ